MKHNSDCPPDQGYLYHYNAPSMMECCVANNRYMWMLYYQAERERDKFVEWANWCLREGKKKRGLPMPTGWEI